MKLLVGVLVVLFTTKMVAQTIEEQPETLPSSLLGLSISGHSYPVFLGGERHKNFSVVYGISKSTQLELQGFYDTYILSERFRSNLVGKVYLNNRLYLFSGMEAEVETAKFGSMPSPFRLGFVAGAGYDITKDFMIEVKSNIQVNDSNLGVYGESLIKMPAVYTFGSKFKF